MGYTRYLAGSWKGCALLQIYKCGCQSLPFVPVIVKFATIELMDEKRWNFLESFQEQEFPHKQHEFF